ncbi:MAG TPA: LptF/LptG family permease [Chitinophagales bacterium]|nr:LptF/LptG family permease [Chitinophagales bacterium]
MKKIDWLLLKSFVGPFVAIFFVTLFVLVMQFLWKYVDDLVGKGLPAYEIGRLLFYASASMVPLALPLAVLLSSIMTIGTLGEHYELTSLKSSGISLLRIISPLMGVAALISVAAFMFANFVLPVANLKFGALLYDIRQQRPAVNIRQGIFYNDIDGYSIRVGNKDPDNQTIHNILIYDHSSGRGNDYVITAKDGKMFMTDDKHFLVLQLFNGKQFQEMAPPSGKKSKDYEQLRIGFKEWRKVFDLSEFSLNKTDENLFKDNYQMQNLGQLRKSMDTLEMELNKTFQESKAFSATYFSFQRTDFDTIQKKPDTLKVAEVTDSFSVYNRALASARNIKGYLSISAKNIKYKGEVLRKFEIEWQRKFSLSFACFILFLIGAPLGAIIKKGGFGLPFVISVFFFVIFYSLSIMGEKMAKEGVLTPFEGMWFSTVLLMPISVFLVYKASIDSVLFNVDAYVGLLKRLLQRWPFEKKGKA